MNLDMNNVCEMMDQTYKEKNNKYNEYYKVLMDNINIQNEISEM